MPNYRHVSYQKANNVQKFAATLDSIDYITRFAKKNRKLFKAIIAAIVIFFAVAIIALILLSTADNRAKVPRTVSGAQTIHGYEVVSEREAIIYFTAGNTYHITLKVEFCQNGAVCLTRQYRFNVDANAFQKLLLIEDDINLYNYDLRGTVIS